MSETLWDETPTARKSQLSQEGDPVEAALVRALQQATTDETILAVVRELEARRRGRP